MQPLPSRLRQLSRPLFAIAALALAGCGNQCDPSVTARCDGATLVTCEWSGDGPFSHTFEERRACDVACAQVTQTAECVLSPAPVPECHDVGAACWNGGVTSCSADFPTSTTKCDPSASCVASRCGPICAVNATPEPRCDANPSGFCDGDVLVACNCGFTESRRPCGAGQCQTRGGDSFCSLSPAIDPQCGDPSQPVNGFCDDGTGFNCQYGFVVGSIGCGNGTCTPHPGASPSCDFKVQSGG